MPDMWMYRLKILFAKYATKNLKKKITSEEIA